MSAVADSSLPFNLTSCSCHYFISGTEWQTIMNISAKLGSWKIIQMNELGKKIISTEKMLSLRQMLKSWYQKLEKSDKFLAIVHFTTRYKQWGWVYLDLPKIFFSSWVNEFFEHICKSSLTLSGTSRSST